MGLTIDVIARAELDEAVDIPYNIGLLLVTRVA